jgi:hypothetical protein
MSNAQQNSRPYARLHCVYAFGLPSEYHIMPVDAVIESIASRYVQSWKDCFVFFVLQRQAGMSTAEKIVLYFSYYREAQHAHRKSYHWQIGENWEVISLLVSLRGCIFHQFSSHMRYPLVFTRFLCSWFRQVMSVRWVYKLLAEQLTDWFLYASAELWLIVHLNYGSVESHDQHHLNFVMTMGYK